MGLLDWERSGKQIDAQLTKALEESLRYIGDTTVVIHDEEGAPPETPSDDDDRFDDLPSDPANH